MNPFIITAIVILAAVSTGAYFYGTKKKPLDRIDLVEGS